jgi:hypothetical protein
MTKKLLLGILFYELASLVVADTAITLDQQQLNNAQQTVQVSGNKAIANMQQSSQALSTIKLKSLNLKPVESEIEYAQPVFKNTKPLSTKVAVIMLISPIISTSLGYTFLSLNRLILLVKLLKKIANKELATTYWAISASKTPKLVSTAGRISTNKIPPPIPISPPIKPPNNPKTNRSR